MHSWSSSNLWRNHHALDSELVGPAQLLAKEFRQHDSNRMMMVILLEIFFVILRFASIEFREFLNHISWISKCSSIGNYRRCKKHGSQPCEYFDESQFFWIIIFASYLISAVSTEWPILASLIEWNIWILNIHFKCGLNSTSYQSNRRMWRWYIYRIIINVLNSICKRFYGGNPNISCSRGFSRELQSIGTQTHILDRFPPVNHHARPSAMQFDLIG